MVIRNIGHFDGLRVAQKNLLRNKLRSLLTLLGAAIGIATFVSLTSVSNSFKSQFYDMIKSYSIDITVTAKGTLTPAGSTISLADYQALGRLKPVRNASSLVIGPIEFPWGSHFLIFGVSSIEGFLNQLGIVEGRVFTPGRKELLLGERAARRFDAKVNDKVLLGQNEMYTVVGICTSINRVINSAAVIDIQDAQRLLKRYDSINMAFLQLTAGSDPQRVAQSINQEFQNLTAVSSGEFITQERLFKTVNVFTWTVTLISFMTCCIILMNTFLMAVSERTKEIGILMAIGWGRAMIMKTIILEALILCLIGGMIGNLLSLLQNWFFNLLNPEGLAAMVPVSLSWDIFLESIGLSLLLGIAGSLYPALRASKLPPAEALRYE
jgi:putative ABC transport system permease protein